ncbi:hypothetical protein [Lactiplantibacillus pentosus]|uniref:hypothetical protein n=1 Tax=Lactiplantibacillus pentosus TaxID=1589 RepID=UPI0028BEC601|nr:hypothetical protein [Lactiplantibacillus pentosus]
MVGRPGLARFQTRSDLTADCGPTKPDGDRQLDNPAGDVASVGMTSVVAKYHHRCVGFDLSIPPDNRNLTALAFLGRQRTSLQQLLLGL